MADLWGTTRYGALAGIFAVPITVAGAVAPWAATALVDLVGGSYPALFAVLAVPVAAVAATGRLPRPVPEGGADRSPAGSRRPANSLTNVDTSSIVDR